MLPQDEAFDLLSSSRRRFVIQRLHETSEPVELSELAASLAAEENDVPIDDLTSQQRKRMYVSLYQTHIPRLTDADVAEYDQDSGTVSPTDHTADLITYFRDSTERQPWALVYGATGLVGIVFYALVSLTDPSVINAMHVGIVFFAFVMLLSLLHYRYANRSIST